MKSLDQLKTKLLRNPQTRAEYEALDGEIETARELIAGSGERQTSPEHADGAALRPGSERARCGADYERYITVQEAAERLNRPVPEIWRMLETGALPAMLRAELESKDGTPLGFDFALLPPEGVARVVDQGGDDFTLEWVYAHGHAKAVCTPARSGSMRVLWEPSLFPELILPTPDVSRDGVDVQTESGPAISQARGAQPALTPEQKADVVSRWNCGRGVSVNKLAPMFSTSRRTIDTALVEAGVKKVALRKERSTNAKTFRKPR